MPFQNNLPEWNSVGTEPTQTKKNEGWKIQEKPPAPYFNWFFNRTFESLKDIINNAIHKEQKGVANGVASLDADGKVPAEQLNVDTSNLATKTEFNEHKADYQQQLGNAELLTSDKTLKGALNELFTNANNLKLDWVDVVGSPLLNSDTSAQLKSKTQMIKNTMATNLTSKGQPSTGTESLLALVTKIASVNTGKRSASGSTTVTLATFTFQYAGNVGTKTLYSALQVSGLSLDFVPSVILATAQIDGYTNVILYTNFGDNFYTKTVKTTHFGASSVSTSSINYKGDANNAYVNNNGFCLPTTTLTQNFSVFDWIAIE